MSEDSEIVRAIIPAAPGWYVAAYYATGHSFYLEPVVAWEVERERYGEGRPCHEVRAITLGDTWDYRTRRVWAIRTPDRMFDFVGDCSFDNEAGALKYAKTCHEKLEAEREETRKKRGAVA